MSKGSIGRVGTLSPLRSGSLPVAIDFGVGSLKVLQVGGGETPSLVAAAELVTPDELLYDPGRRLQFQMEALPRLVKSGKFRSQRAVCGIPAGQMLCKHLQIQKAEGVATSALVQASLPSQLGCESSELVCRHSEVGEVGRGGKTEVICYAVSRELVARLMFAAKSSRLRPVGIHSEFNAMLQAFTGMSEDSRDDGTTTLYLDIGRGSTKAAIAHGPSLVFARSIDFGGLHLDTALTSQLKCSLSQAQDLRLSLEHLTPGDRDHAERTRARAEAEGAPAETEGAPAEVPAETSLAVIGGADEDDGDTGVHPVNREPDLTEALEILTDEISMCLRYHRSLFPGRAVDRAVFVGGESRHRGLCQHVARVLRLPAQLADPLAAIGRCGNEPTIGVNLSDPQPGWAVALGMCLSPTDL